MLGHASSSRSLVRARTSRVLTVPCGMLSARAASRVVRPSNTVACSTTRSSGDNRASAVPRSEYSTVSSAVSSAETSTASYSFQVGVLRGTAAGQPEPADQPTDGYPPQPGGDIPIAAELAGAVPSRDEGVLQHVRDYVGVSAPSPQPRGDPRGVAAVEQPKRGLVVLGHRVDEVGVCGITVSHTLTVAPCDQIGSATAKLSSAAASSPSVFGSASPIVQADGALANRSPVWPAGVPDPTHRAFRHRLLKASTGGLAAERSPRT